MKSILQGSKKVPTEGSKYPYLGVNLGVGVVVLFTSCSTGFAVHEVDPPLAHRTYIHTIGQRDNSWDEDNFEPLKGKIILSN